MFYKVYISKVNKNVTVIANGLYNNKDVEELVLTVLTQEDYNPHYEILVDLREIKYVSSVFDMFSVSSSFTEMRQYFKGKIGIVVKNGFIYRTFRLASHFNIKNGIAVNIFNDFDKAIVWLSDRRKERRSNELIG